MSNDLPLEGGCLCGAIRYRLNARPLDAGYCHCRLCQRSAGAPVLAWATIPIDDFVCTGEPGRYRSSSWGLRLFCRDCGTQIGYREVENAKRVDINIVTLDDPEQIVPEYHIWTHSQLDWFDVRDDLPRHEDSGPDQ